MTKYAITPEFAVRRVDTWRNGLYEAIEYNGVVYCRGPYSSHGLNLEDLAADLVGPIRPDDWAAFDVFYSFLYEGQPLHKKIKHGWFTPEHKYFEWNYYFGE